MIEESDLLQRLAMRSDAVVDDVYEIAKQQLDDQDTRDATLNAKANTVLGASGLSLTVAFTFGAFLLQHPERLAFGHFGFCIVVVLFGVSMLLGLVASYLAIRGLKVAHYEYISEASVFDKTNLRAADGAWETALTATEGGRPAAERAALSVYRRYLAAHLWGIYQRTSELLENKAENVKKAQRFYVGFLVAIMAIGIALTISAVALAPRETVAVSAPSFSRVDASTSDARGRNQSDATTDGHD